MVQHNTLIKRLECKINKEWKKELFGALGAEGKNSISEEVLIILNLHDSAKKSNAR